jgi:hypothetical protein
VRYKHPEEPSSSILDIFLDPTNSSRIKSYDLRKTPHITNDLRGENRLGTSICDLRGDNFIEGFWDGSEWLSMIIWGALPGLAAAASRLKYRTAAGASRNLNRLTACSSDCSFASWLVVAPWW